jgi:TRAP-type uncharacterized transport system fused permease subunit
MKAASTILLSLLGLAASIWRLAWHLPTTISPPGCDTEHLPLGLGANCVKITYIFHPTVLGLPLAAIGCGYFAIMAGLCLPRLWRSRFGGVHALRLLLSATGTSLIVYLVTTEPTLAWSRYPVLTLALVFAVLLFAMVVPMTARAIRSPASDPPGWHRNAAIRLSLR